MFSEHRQQIAALRQAVPPIRPPNPFDAIEAALAESFSGAEKVEPPPWDHVEDALAQDPTTWLGPR